MNKTLFALALLNYNWEKNNKDIIDSYVPLSCTIIREKEYKIIDRDILKNDFIESYGINISLGAIESILKRMIKNGLLSRNNGVYKILEGKIFEEIKPSVKETLDTDFREILNHFIIYSKKEFGIDFTFEDCEMGLISFLKEYDVDLLFANNDGSTVLPQIKESKKIKYIIATFITKLYKEEPSKFSMILKLAKGYSIASLITYSDLNAYSGSLENVSIYIDAPIIFNLIGINGESNLKLSQELIKELQTQKAKLCIFEINHNEVVGTIQEAINRLRSGKYDLRFCSRILRTAVRENISISTLQLKLNQLESILRKSQIEVVQTPPVVNTKFQINEQKLTDIINSLYQNIDNQSLPYYKTTQIEKDVISISSIFRIREDSLALSLKSCKALLITNNEQIAYASKKYEREESDYKSSIPPCVTDIFLSTILWANYPNKNDSLNIKRLMSECYSMMEIDSRLLNSYYRDIERMHDENTITDDDYCLMTATNLAYNLLEKKTLNDYEDFTDKTVAEILEDIHLNFQNEVLIQKEINDTSDYNILKICKKIARVIFILVTFTIAAIAIILKIKSGWNFSYIIFDGIYYLISAFIAAFGIFRWAELIPTKSKIEDWISNGLYSWIKKILNKK